MADRYPGYLFGGMPVSSWERNYNSLDNHVQQQYRGRLAARRWGSMSEGGASALAGAGDAEGPAGDGGGGGGGGGGGSARTNLIVNYLPQTVTEKDLFAMFMAIGPIESCRVMKDFKTGYSYGFGFVNFVREEDAARAIDSFNGYQLRNKRLKVSYARPSGEEIKDTNLYVTSLPRGVTDATLETIFGKYGRIVQKHILRDKSSGHPRGVAFVRFDKREEAQEAIAALNNVIPEGGTEPLSVKVAEEHGKQKAAYYAGWAAGYHHNRDDYTWDECGGCPGGAWDPPPPPARYCRGPHPPAHPPAPRPACPRGKGPRARAARLPPWAPAFGDDRFKGQRCRNGPAPYW